MEHVCTKARFAFWDGKTLYTVMYHFGISVWYVFNNDEESNCIYQKRNVTSNNIDKFEAEDVLYDFLNAIPQHN